MKTIRLLVATPFLFLGLLIVAFSALIMGDDPLEIEEFRRISRPVS